MHWFVSLAASYSFRLLLIASDERALAYFFWHSLFPCERKRKATLRDLADRHIPELLTGNIPIKLPYQILIFKHTGILVEATVFARLKIKDKRISDIKYWCYHNSSFILKMIALSMSVLYENSHLLPSTLGVKSSS
jgi:hypothetical protein